MGKEKAKALNWRWEKLLENHPDAVKPMGICGVIDHFFWGDLNLEQKALINNRKIVEGVLNG